MKFQPYEERGSTHEFDFGGLAVASSKEYLEFVLGPVIGSGRNYLSIYDGRIYYLLSWQDCRWYL